MKSILSGAELRAIEMALDRINDEGVTSVFVHDAMKRKINK